MASNTQKNVGLAVGAAAAAAAAAAGAYWLYGAKDAAKNRRAVRSWMFKARAEVLDAVEKLKDIDKEKYMAIVASVMKRYSKTAGVTAKDLSEMAKELKGAWDHMQKTRTGAVVKKSVKKAVKSATKKR
jgi:hypothetical protein